MLPGTSLSKAKIRMDIPIKVKIISKKRLMT